MITLDKLKFSYKEKEVLKGIDFSFVEGHLYCLVGENGAGKTTLLELMLGLKPLQTGTILFDNNRLTDTDIFKKIGTVFQENSLRPRLKVREEIASYVDLYQVSNEWREVIVEMFELSELMNKIGNALSGGERRRVLMALAFIHRPKYLILDEPFTGIDTKLRNKLRLFMEDYCKQNQAIILFSEHNILECQKFNYHFIFMYEGKFILSGTHEEIANKLWTNKSYQFTDLEELYLDIWKGKVPNENLT